MTYIAFDGRTFATDTSEEIAEAREAMKAHGLTEAKVYSCPYDTIEAAEAAGFDGAYATTMLFADGDGSITIALDGADVGEWGAESTEDVLSRYAAYVADRTGCDVTVEGSRTTCENTTWEPVDVQQTLWEEFCSGHNNDDFLAKYGPDAA